MLSTQQREMRKQFMGSSDAAAVLSLDPFRSPSDVWLEKTGKVDDWEGNEATARGTYLEDGILRWAEAKLGLQLVRDQMFVAPDKIRCANCDAIIPGKAVIEGKSTSASDEYGDAETDQVPERVNVQVHHQMEIVGVEVRIAWVPVLMPVIIPGGRAIFQFRMYRVDRNDELAGIVRDEVCRFHDRYIKTDTRPDDFRPSIEVLKRARRVPNKIVPVTCETFARLLAAKEAKKLADKEEREAQAALLAELADGEGGECDAGTLTYLEQSRKAYQVDATKFRVLKLKAASAAGAAS